MPKRPAPLPDWERDWEEEPAEEPAEAVPPPPEPFEGSWEAQGFPGSQPDDCASDDQPDEPDPAAEYVHHMLMLYFRRKIVAQDLCLAMFWASKAGLAAATQWAYPPGRQTGKYAAFLTKKLGHGCTGMFYNLPVPGFFKGEGRASVPLLVAPPHEALEEAAQKGPHHWDSPA